MIALIPINILRIMLLLVAQILIFSNLHLGTWVSPYVYPLCILLLPFETPLWLIMLLGFGCGLSIDLFLGSMGMHASATLLLAYIRPGLIRMITPKGAEFEVEPNIYQQGVTWFLFYCGISVLIHHMLYFLIESGSLAQLLTVTFRAGISCFFSVLFMMLFLFLFTSSRKRRLT
jgi:hypothetical protein